MHMPEKDKTPLSQDDAHNNKEIKSDAQSTATALKQAEQDIKNDPDMLKNRMQLQILTKESWQDLKGISKATMYYYTQTG